MSDISIEEFFDGWALWQEHKPQDAEDWMAVAERCLAAGHDESVSSPLFAALYKVTRNLRIAVEALENIERFCTFDDDRRRTDWLPYMTVEQLAHDALGEIGRKEAG